MATNTDPIFTGTPDNQWSATITAANTAKDGTGTVNLLYTAGVDGGFVGMIGAKPKGTNVASVARFFLNNGSDPTVAANNMMLGEMTLPATTLSEVAALIELGYPVFRNIKASHRIYVTLGTAVAAGWQFNADCGSYTKS